VRGGRDDPTAYSIWKDIPTSPLSSISGIFKALTEALEIPPHAEKGVAGGKKKGSSKGDGSN